jgi:hypothetical protein
MIDTKVLRQVGLGVVGIAFVAFVIASRSLDGYGDFEVK